MRRLVFAVALLLTQRTQAHAQSRPCGNGKIDSSSRHTCAPCTAGSTDCPCATVKVALELCDGADLGGKTCQTEGAFEGKLRCTKACQLDTGSCTKLPGDLSPRHLALGAAPRGVSLAFSTNVLVIVTQGLKAATMTPYNFDFRGPWGSVTTVPAARLDLVGSGWGLVRATQRGPDVLVSGVGVNGEARVLQTFKAERLVAAAPSYAGGTLIATERGSVHALRYLAMDGKLGPRPLEIAGVVRAVSAHTKGFVVAYTDDQKQLQLRLLGPDLAELGAAAMPAPTSFAIAPAPSDGLLIAYATANETVAVIRAADATLTAGAPMQLASRARRVVAAGFAGSPGGSHVILDDDAGTIAVAQIGERAAVAKVRTMLSRRGAKAFASTTGYDRIYVAWTVDRKLYVSSVPTMLN